MNFTYTYKDQTGARREAVLDAESRAQVFAILKAKGVTPLSVREGGKVVESTPRAGAGWVRGASAGALVIVAAVAAWMLLKDSAPPAPGKETEAKVVSKSTPTKKAVPVASHAVKASVSAEAAQPPPSSVANRTEAAGEETPVPTNVAQTAAASPERPKPAFKTGVEQVMGWIFTTELGSVPPPLPNLSKKEMQNIVSIILSKNEVTEQDSERTALAKNVVEQAKKELMQYLKNGGDPQSFLAFYHNELKKASDEWRDAQKLVLQSRKEEGAEAGLAFADEVNKRLSEKGIRQVKIPPKYLKAQNGEESGK